MTDGTFTIHTREGLIDSYEVHAGHVLGARARMDAFRPFEGMSATVENMKACLAVLHAATESR